MVARGEVYRHHKRRGTYDILGVGKLQAAGWFEVVTDDVYLTPKNSPVDMVDMVLYRSREDGTFWARPLEEFIDGRFTLIIAPGPARHNTYAIRSAGGWRICQAVHASKYAVKEDKWVWSEDETTAYICDVGEEEQRIWLEGGGTHRSQE